MDSSASVNPKNNGKDKVTDDHEETQDELVTPDSRGKRKTFGSSSGAAFEPAKEHKILSPRSRVWEHYTRTQENRDRCYCHHCKKSFACASKSGTSNLGKHLTTCKRYLAWEAARKKNQTELADDGTVRDTKVSEAQVREATNEMLVIGEMPLSFVESIAWKHFCNKVIGLKPHSRRTATRDIVELYVKRKAALKAWFKANKQRVSLTTDIWVAPTTGNVTVFFFQYVSFLYFTNLFLEM